MKLPYIAAALLAFAVLLIIDIAERNPSTTPPNPPAGAVETGGEPLPSWQTYPPTSVEELAATPTTPPARLALAIRINPADTLDHHFPHRYGTDPLDVWTDGYLDAGAPADLLPLFLTIDPPGILWCESAHDPNAVRARADWGLAQINRAAHHDRYEAIFGTGSFETSVTDPYNNGYIAGVITLNSIADGNPGTQPWYKSAHCSHAPTQ